jgi:hypothetical protein
MTHFGECIRCSLVNRRSKPTEGQREDPVAGTETGSRGSLCRNDGCQTTAPDNVPWLAGRQDREGSCLERLMRSSLAHDFDRLIGSATLIGYKITKMLWGVGKS